MGEEISSQNREINVAFKLLGMFEIYLKIQWKKNGLYLVGQSSNGSHRSYHSDGVYFEHIFDPGNPKKSIPVFVNSIDAV